MNKKARFVGFVVLLVLLGVLFRWSPAAGWLTKENILRGQTVFNNTCTVCHGPKGDGNGSIVPKFPRPPAVTSAKVTDWPDGRIFHVMTRGQNLMGSYASQIPPGDRWAAVHYVRALQRAAHPTKDDIEALKKALKEKTYP